MTVTTRDWLETVKERMMRDPEFVDAMLEQFVEAQAEIERLEKLLEATERK